MRLLLKRAWQETAKSYGLTWGAGIRSLLVPLATFFLLYTVLGGPKAVSDGWTLGLSGLAAVCAGFLPLFLWNLWLAPYKILNERLDEVASAHTPPKKVDEEAERRSRNHVRNQGTRFDMGRLQHCIQERENRRHGHSHYPQSEQDFDHDFMTLREKYSSWLPSGLRERKIIDWAGRFISILNAYEYEDAVKRIEQAVTEMSRVEGSKK